MFSAFILGIGIGFFISGWMALRTVRRFRQELEEALVDENPDPVCGLCGEHVPMETIIEHVRVVHDITEEIQTWPDGSPVVVDHTLEPEDFA